MAWALSHKPRDWQVDALESWKSNNNRGIAKIVTGGGKTFFSFMCMKNLYEKDLDLRFFIVVPTIALRDQWKLDLIDDLRVLDEEIYAHGLDKKVNSKHKIFLIVINSARKYVSSMTSEGKWMLIVDECHRAASEENQKSMEGNWYATLGLSATPERQYDDWFEERLIPKLGGIIANYDYVQAKKDGVIVDFELRNYKVPLNPDESNKMEKLTKSIAIERMMLSASGLQTSDLLLNLLMKRARISQRAENRIPVSMAICKEFQGERILIFHEFIESADQITRILDDLGFRVAAYHSKIGNEIRLSNLKMFRDGMIDVLVTCKALDEGLNVPNTTVGIIIASTKSIRQRIQRMGRILRTAENKELGIIISLFTENEQEILEQEAESLGEVSNVLWFGDTK